jgi:hypothetical protein
LPSDIAPQPSIEQPLPQSPQRETSINRQNRAPAIPPTPVMPSRQRPSERDEDSAFASQTAGDRIMRVEFVSLLVGARRPRQAESPQDGAIGLVNQKKFRKKVIEREFLFFFPFSPQIRTKEIIQAQPDFFFFFFLFL